MALRLLRYDRLLIVGAVRQQIHGVADVLLVAGFAAIVIGFYYVRVTALAAASASVALGAMAAVAFLCMLTGVSALWRHLARHRTASPLGAEALHPAATRRYAATGIVLTGLFAALALIPIYWVAPAAAGALLTAALLGGAFGAAAAGFRRATGAGRSAHPPTRHPSTRGKDRLSYAVLFHRAAWRGLGFAPSPGQAMALVGASGLLVTACSHWVGGAPRVAGVVAALASAAPLALLLPRVDLQLVRFATLSGMALRRLLAIELRFCTGHIGAATASAALATDIGLHVAIVLASGILFAIGRGWAVLHARVNAGRGAQRAAKIELGTIAMGIMLFAPIGLVFAGMRLSRLLKRSRAATWVIAD